MSCVLGVSARGMPGWWRWQNASCHPLQSCGYWSISFAPSSPHAAELDPHAAASNFFTNVEAGTFSASRWRRQYPGQWDQNAGLACLREPLVVTGPTSGSAGRGAPPAIPPARPDALKRAGRFRSIGTPFFADPRSNSARACGCTFPCSTMPTASLMVRRAKAADESIPLITMSSRLRQAEVGCDHIRMAFHFALFLSVESSFLLETA